MKKMKDYAFQIGQVVDVDHILHGLLHVETSQTFENLTESKRDVIKLKYAKNYQSKEPLMSLKGQVTSSHSRELNLASRPSIKYPAVVTSSHSPLAAIAAQSRTIDDSREE